VRILLALCANAVLASSTFAADAVPTGQLPHTAVPQHYALEFRVDPKAEGFTAKSTLHLKLLEAADHVWMHGKAIEIDRLVLVDAAGKEHAAKYAVADATTGVVRIDFGQSLPPQELDLRFAFHAKYSAQLEGLYKSTHLGTPYIVTQMEPISARLAFPGFDEPVFKSKFDISVETPQDNVAVSNMPSLSEEKIADGWKHVRFATTPALPTYLVALAVGPWDVVEGPAIPASKWRKNAVPLRGLAAKGEGPRLQHALSQTPPIVIALEDYFGYGFPFPKLDLLAAPDFSAGAMENPGLIVFRDLALLLDANSPVRTRQRVFAVTAHELAHQWFGDTVTMAWWDDVWLNEAFATWLERKVEMQLKPEHHSEMEAMEGVQYAMGTDSMDSARRVRQPIGDSGDIEGAFDGITYSKGSAVLGMFEAYLGEDKFRSGIRQYVAKHEFANATADDLIDALSASSDQGQRFQAAMKSFLDRPGVPLLSTRLECKEGKVTLHLSQQRYLPVGSTGDKNQTWGLPVCVRVGQGKESAARCELLDQAEGTMELGNRCPDWYFPNADGRGYYRVGMAAADVDRLGNVTTRLNATEQLAYADAIDAGFEHGDLNAPAVLQAMERLAKAPTRQVTGALFKTYAWMREHLADDAARVKLDAWADRTYRPRLEALGYTKRTNESQDDVLLRADLTQFLIGEARDGAVSKALLPQADAMLANAKNGSLDVSAVNPDLLGSVLTVLVQQRGAPAMDAIMEDLKHQTQPALRMSMAASLGTTHDAALVKKALAFSLTDAVKLAEGYRLLAVAHGQPENRAVFWSWFQANYDALIKRLPPYGRGRLPETVAEGRCSAAEEQELTAFFKPRQEKLVGGAQGLTRGTESIRLCAALRARQDAKALSGWLDGAK
jgi:alanyl aminopeptidase